VGAGVYKSYKEAVDIAVHVTKEYTPDPKLAGVYNDGYERFVKTYTSLAKGGIF